VLKQQKKGGKERLVFGAGVELHGRPTAEQYVGCQPYGVLSSFGSRVEQLGTAMA
jgi:hypothetical protein